MNTKYKIEVVHDDTGDVVKTLTYRTEREANKAYKALLSQMDLLEFNASVIGPEDNK
tara:strand:+ start:589 stop:759 length:171 start_codon:yes stop_codon:yes gene_type:complete